VAFDLPTQLGYDADHPMAHGEVGRVGVSICSLEDMRRLLDGIPLDRVSLSMTINAPAAILLAMVLALAREQGVDWKQLRGTVQNDILKEYVARGLYIFPPEPSMRLAVDVMAFCHRHVPNWNPISISGYHIREAGATAVQEVAFTFAHALSMCGPPLVPASPSTTSAPSSRSSSTPTTISWRKWPSSAPPAGCGPAWPGIA
jgi:methylmalonyl-CoA mutase N-terminal domain/subunit